MKANQSMTRCEKQMPNGIRISNEAVVNFSLWRLDCPATYGSWDTDPKTKDMTTAEYREWQKKRYEEAKRKLAAGIGKES